MIQWFKSLFKPSVDRIVNNFSKTVKKLEDAALHHNEEAGRHSAIASAAVSKAAEHQQEGERAKAVAGKISSLLS
jgi:hypothetical protein